jgi:UDP-N-acetylglucosamine 2-epimerase (hydrolysing)
METARKRILFLTSTRADFGKIKPLIEQVEKSREFECHIFATGMHTLSQYDYTFVEMRKLGYKNLFLHINQKSGNDSEMDIVLANTIQGLSYYIHEFPPDLMVVHGDRVEALAGAIVGALNNVLVAHIEGGELSGTVDELIRHAVSKLSHVHFVSNDESRKRLLQMGEISDSIFVIGSPEVDLMLSDRLPSISEVEERYGISFTDFAIFVYHPVTTEMHELGRNINAVVDAILACDWNFVVIYPNSDLGSHLIMEALDRLKGNPRFRIFPSLRFEYFLTLLKHAKAIVGNSSVGVREAPVYGVPSVNIGSREKNRFHYSSIINVPEDKEAILKAMRDLPTDVEPSLHFGRGNSADAFMAALCNPQLWKTSRQKQFQDVKGTTDS